PAGEIGGLTPQAVLDLATDHLSPKRKTPADLCRQGWERQPGTGVLRGAFVFLLFVALEALAPKGAWWPVYRVARDARESGNGGAKKHIVERIDRARNFDIIGFVLMRPDRLVRAQTVFEREEPGDVDDRDYACIFRLG